jgi:FixJ family two-component response regulator
MRPAPVVSVVDDDEPVRRAIDSLFRSVGFRVAAFASAEEFLGSEGLGRTECLILDLQMPGMDGLQLQRRLNLDGHRFPIVILTGHGDADMRARVMDAGAVAFLLKPFDGDMLVATVRRATDGG